MKLSRLGYDWFLLGLLSVMAFSLIDPVLSHSQQPGQSEKSAYSQEVQSEEEWKVIATSPGVQVLSDVQSNPGKVLVDEDLTDDIALGWLADRHLEEGRNFKKGKLLYISVGTSSVRAKPSDKGFIDSRFLAFQRAELIAKAKVAIFLGTDLTTARGASEREINPEERAALEDIVNTSSTLKENTRLMKVSDTIYDLFEKAKTLAGAKLDQAIKDTGTDTSERLQEIDQEKVSKKAKREKSGRLRNISEASLKAAASAFSEVQGTQVIQTFEGSYKDGYKVVVITLWSQNLQKLVDSMLAGTAPYGLSRNSAKKEVAAQLPKNQKELACMTGVRAFINQDGEHVLLAFGQAGVEVVGGRKDMAYELAGKKARLRAMAAMRSFMGEKVAFQANEELAEVLALYADEYDGGEGEQEYKSISQFHEKIQAVSAKKKLTGLHGLLTRELVHPFTDKPMVIKIMAWSPSSQAMSKQVKQAIEQKSEHTQSVKSVGKVKSEVPARKGVISSGSGADEDAW